MLTIDEHFEKMAGSEVEVKLYRAVDGAKVFRGVLVGKVDGKITVATDAGEISFEAKTVAKCTTVFDWQSAMNN